MGFATLYPSYQAEQFPYRYLLYVSVSAIHGFWITAIPAGMTCFKILVYKDESLSLGTSINLEIIASLPRGE